MRQVSIKFFLHQKGPNRSIPVLAKLALGEWQAQKIYALSDPRTSQLIAAVGAEPGTASENEAEGACLSCGSVGDKFTDGIVLFTSS